MSINPRISLADLTAIVHADPSSDLLYGGGTSVLHCRAKALPPTISNYTFNARNQLTQYVEQDENNNTIKTLSYTYDALGRRVSKTEDNTTQQYLYDGDDIVAILDSNNAVIVTITHDESIDTPLSITNANGTFYYHRDHQGSIVALTDSTGAVVESFEYDNHYGTIVNHTKTIETNNPYAYTGRELDTDELYYYRARYYDPSLERFLGEDPIGFASGDFNWYRYVGNKPNILKDPTGEKASCKSRIKLILDVAVYLACKRFPNKCKETDSCFMLKIKKGIKYACIGARLTINYVCYKGGNKGHRNAINEMRGGLKKCDRQYKTNKCDKKKCDGN